MFVTWRAASGARRNSASASDHPHPHRPGGGGAAAVSGRAEVVAAVSKDPRYLVCFAPAKSVIVVPIRAGSGVIGELDIGAKELNAFGASDQEFLESVAALLAALRPAVPERPTTARPATV